MKAYLSALDHLATMLGPGGPKWFEDDRLKMVLRGVRNLERGGAVRGKKSRAITVSDLLKIRKKNLLKPIGVWDLSNPFGLAA